jgi:transcriptional regulator with XRE-family HTH domain
MAEQILTVRKRRGLTAQKLAERCAAAGSRKLTAATLANIETGRRKSMTIEELFVLAVALDVPPLVLLTPDEGRVTVATGRELDAMQLVTWMSGVTPAGGLPTVGYQREARTLRMYRSAFDAVEAAKGADIAATQARGSDGERQAADKRDEQLQRLAGLIEPVLLSGIIPSNLPYIWLSEMAARGWLDASIIPPIPSSGDEEGTDG